MKKVAFVVSGKSPITIPGGLGAYSYNVARILHSLGYQVYILGFSQREETLDLDFATLVHFVNPYDTLLGLGSLMAASFFVSRMEKIIQQTGPEEVVIYSAGIWGIAGVKLKEKMSGKKITAKTVVGYFTTHKHEYRGHVIGSPAGDYGLVQSLVMRAAYRFARTVYSPVERRMLAATDLVVVHYDSTRQILLEEFRRLAPEKVVKTPYYIDIYERQSEVKIVKGTRSANGIPTVTVLCRQDPRKGINTFLKAVKIARERGLSFNCIVAGSGVFLQQNKRLAEKLGLKDFVEFPGFVDSVDKILDNTDIYVLPSVEEGSGAISLLEAMKKGVAILTTLCDGIPEDFVNNETALLVPPGNPPEMARALELLLNDESLRSRLANNVSTDYGKRFSFEQMKNGLQDLLQQP